MADSLQNMHNCLYSRMLFSLHAPFKHLQVSNQALSSCFKHIASSDFPHMNSQRHIVFFSPDCPNWTIKRLQVVQDTWSVGVFAGQKLWAARTDEAYTSC